MIPHNKAKAKDYSNLPDKTSRQWVFFPKKVKQEVKPQILEKFPFGSLSVHFAELPMKTRIKKVLFNCF